MSFSSDLIDIYQQQLALGDRGRIPRSAQVASVVFDELMGIPRLDPTRDVRTLSLFGINITENPMLAAGKIYFFNREGQLIPELTI